MKCSQHIVEFARAGIFSINDAVSPEVGTALKTKPRGAEKKSCGCPAPCAWTLEVIVTLATCHAVDSGRVLCYDKLDLGYSLNSSHPPLITLIVVPYINRPLYKIPLRELRLWLIWGCAGNWTQEQFDKQASMRNRGLDFRFGF